MQGYIIAAFYNGQTVFTFYECEVKKENGFVNPFSEDAEEIVLEPGMHVPANWPERQCVVSFVAIVSSHERSAAIRSLKQQALLAGVNYFYEPEPVVEQAD